MQQAEQLLRNQSQLHLQVLALYVITQSAVRASQSQVQVQQTTSQYVQMEQLEQVQS